MAAIFTKILPCSSAGGSPIPSMLRVSVIDAENRHRTLGVALPEALTPSSVGIQHLLATSVAPSEFGKAIAAASQAPNPGDRSIRLYIDEPVQDDEPVVYWCAFAPRVFNAIWEEVKLVCEEEEFIVEMVEVL